MWARSQFLQWCPDWGFPAHKESRHSAVWPVPHVSQGFHFTCIFFFFPSRDQAETYDYLFLSFCAAGWIFFFFSSCPFFHPGQNCVTLAFIEFRLLPSVAQGLIFVPWGRWHPEPLLGGLWTAFGVWLWFLASLWLVIPFLCCKLRRTLETLLVCLFHPSFLGVCGGRVWFYPHL